MQRRLPSTLLSLVLLAAPALATTGRAPNSTRPLAPAQSRTLHAIEDPSLGELRAGASASKSSIQGQERAALASAAARSSDLEKLRAGDVTLTDHDIKLIAIVAAVVILIVIIA